MLLIAQKIEKEAFANTTLNRLPGWDFMMGLQFENLVVHNRKMIWSLLHLSPEEFIMDGPFFQNSTLRQPGCQIDYMIQTRFSLYLCEVKFSKNRIGPKIIKGIVEKRKCLKIPKFCSIRPILIHVNGVQESVINKEYFDKVMDFGLLLA